MIRINEAVLREWWEILDEETYTKVIEDFSAHFFANFMCIERTEGGLNAKINMERITDSELKAQIDDTVLLLKQIFEKHIKDEAKIENLLNVFFTSTFSLPELIVKKIEEESCPSLNELVKYIEGKHPSEEVEIIERHLEICHTCKDKIEQIKSPISAFQKISRNLKSIVSETTKDLWMKFQGVIANLTILEPIGAHVHGQGLRLISPRNSYIRPGDDIYFKFEDTFTDARYEYEISLLEDNREIFKETGSIEKGERGKKITITHHKKLQLRKGKEYRWVVETKHERKGTTFKVLEDIPLNFLKQMEEELNKIKDKTERDFLLGALYESVGLYDDAIEKYKSILEKYNFHIRALMQLSMVYAKKLAFEKNVDPCNLSVDDVRSDIDLANEMDRWINKIWRVANES